MRMSASCDCSIEEVRFDTGHNGNFRVNEKQCTCNYATVLCAHTHAELPRLLHRIHRTKSKSRQLTSTPTL